jgi:O6-methylguanine-DNA--protein-cysteine methyltransferase
MQNFFHKLLELSSIEMNQSQREALVDLCLLGMYSDNLISIAEQDFLKDESTKLSWESAISFDAYLQTATSEIRSVSNDAAKKKELIQDIEHRLGSTKFKQKAIEELELILSTDKVVKLEQSFLDEVKAIMGI